MDTIKASTTQTRHPVRAVIRSVIAFVIPLAALAPVIYEAATNHNPEAATGASAIALGVAAGITRVLAIPGVEKLLRSSPLTSWLAASPAEAEIVGEQDAA